jgi:hypothetical protein
MFPLFSVLIPSLRRPDGRQPMNDMGHSSYHAQVYRLVACMPPRGSPSPFLLGTDSFARDESP